MKINSQLMPELIPAVLAHFFFFKNKNNRGSDKRAFGSRFPNGLQEPVSNYRTLDGDGAGAGSTWLLCFLKKRNTCHPHSFIPLCIPCFQALTEGGRAAQDERGALANTQAADIWSPSHVLAKAERQKKPSHIPARKKARESLRDESCVSCYSHSSSFSSSFYFDLRAELL